MGALEGLSPKQRVDLEKVAADAVENWNVEEAAHSSSSTVDAQLQKLLHEHWELSERILDLEEE